MTTELKFDRARWEAGEMPRLRDGRKVLSLHWDREMCEWIGIFESGAGGLIAGHWLSEGGRIRAPSGGESDLVHDPLPTDEQPEQSGVYMVSVDGADAPAFEHPSFESAMREAERLSRVGVKNKIRVLRVESVYIPTQHVEWAWHVPVPVYDAPF